MFQQTGAAALLAGENPYEDRYPNLYEGHPEFYGPGVVDANKHLTVGLPYPPLSLLLTLPGMSSAAIPAMQTSRRSPVRPL
jgi:hypothetical protein